MTRIPSQRHRFDLPDDVAYLNCAYMSPLMRDAVTTGKAAIERKSRPWEIRPADFFAGTDRARNAFAALLGMPATADHIAIVPAVSYGMATAALNVPVARGSKLLVLEGEFPSTVLTWRERARAAGAELVRLERPADDDWTRVVLDAIDSATSVAALPALHWLDGAVLDLPLIRNKLRGVGAALVLDLTQSLGAMPFDLAGADPDFAVAACYKWLLGPYSVGFLYVAPRWHDGRPLEHHWYARKGSENFGQLIDYPEELQPGARRFDVGEPSNFALLPPAIVALDQLREWGVADIAETLGVLTDEIVDRAVRLGFTAVPTRLRARHYLGLRAAGALPPHLPDALAAENVFVSVRGGQTLRVTPHVYNERRDIDRLFAALEQFA